MARTRPTDHQQTLARFTAEYPVLPAVLAHTADTDTVGAGYDRHSWQLTRTHISSCTGRSIGTTMSG